MPVTTNTRKLAALLGASGAGIGTDGLLQAAAVDANIATQAELDALETETDEMRTNQAIIAIRQAADHNDVKYNLQDRTIDTYYDASGIDATPSTNHVLTSGVYSSVSIDTVTSAGTSAQSTDGLYTYYVWTATSGTRTFTNASTLNIDYLVVAGGGAAGSSYSGGGGAGGFRTAATYSLPAAAHSITVGAGGAAGANSSTSGVGGNGGNSSIASLIVSAGGGGGGPGENTTAAAGGSGGGGGGNSKPGAAGNTPSTSPSQGNDGGDGVQGSNQGNGGGGGGASAAGGDAGVGGAGENNVMGMNDSDSDAFLTALSVGHDSGGTRYFSGGGGGGAYGPSGGTGDAGGVGGGGTGASANSTSGSAGTANTGGGGGGSGTGAVGGIGGSGIVIIRYLTSALSTYNDLILQSTDTAAEAAPTKADMVTLIEDSAGTATINTDIKGYVSRDSGVTFIEGTLVDEGDWGTNKRILAFHDLSFTGASGTAMCYKITTHNQSASKTTKIHATSIGWK